MTKLAGLIMACLLVLGPSRLSAQTADDRESLARSRTRLLDSIPAAVASAGLQPRWTDSQPSNVTKGALVGLAVGGVVGVFVGAVYCDGYHCAQAEILFASMLGGAGAAIGAGVGALSAANTVEPGRRTTPILGRPRRVLIAWRF